MLFFRSEEDVRAWQRERNVAGGEILSLEQLWELSQKWYGNRLNHDFHGRSLEQAQAIFRDMKFESEFWYVNG
jgi:hypothetical protein